jgi:hypothetical protein
VAAKLTHSTTASATGVVAIAFGASPLGGFNAVAELGTATSATVELYVRVGSASAWLLADTLSLTVGAPSLNVPVYPPYDEAQWNVTAIAGGNVKLNAIGVGL